MPKTVDDLTVGELVPVYVKVTQLEDFRPEFKAEIFSKTDQYQAWIHEKHLDPGWLKEADLYSVNEAIDELKIVLSRATTMDPKKIIRLIETLDNLKE